MSPLFKQRGQWTVEHERWLFNQSIGHHSTPSHRRPCRLHYSERACTRKWWTFAYLLPSHSELCVTPRKGHKITFDMRSWGRWVKSPCAIYINTYSTHPALSFSHPPLAMLSLFSPYTWQLYFSWMAANGMAEGGKQMFIRWVGPPNKWDVAPGQPNECANRKFI